jgi:hypothetical protein
VVRPHSSFSSKEHDKPDPPEKYKTDEQFQDIKSRMDIYLKNFGSNFNRNPLNYVICEKVEVTDDLRGIDDDIYHTTVLEGGQWKLNNRNIANYLCPLLEGTDLWQTVVLKNKARDGRGMWKEICKKMEGKYQRTTRHNMAESIIRGTIYTGKGKFTLAKYTDVHLECHNILADIGHPMSDPSKEKYYIDNASGSELMTPSR